MRKLGVSSTTPDKEVIACCRIGERSSHTRFVLKHLLGYPTRNPFEDKTPRGCRKSLA